MDIETAADSPNRRVGRFPECRRRDAFIKKPGRL
jgi:hypothetical protein